MSISSSTNFWTQDLTVYTNPENSETWIKVDSIWVSNKGNAIDPEGKVLNLSSQNKWTYKRNVYQRNKTLAIAFKIQDYQKLGDNSFIVTLKDKSKDFCLNNLMVCKRGSSMNETLPEKKDQAVDAFEDTEVLKQLPQKPNYAISNDGLVFNICNLTRPLNSTNNNRNVFRFRDEFGVQHTQYTDILVCMLFNPFLNLLEYSDYVEQCNIIHKNGNLRDDKVSNLEVNWKDATKESQRKLNERKRISELQEKVESWLLARGAKLVSAKDLITSVHCVITYFCKCDTQFSKIIKDCIDSTFCMTCKNKQTKDTVMDSSFDFTIGTEEFVKIPGGWVSKQGNFLNLNKEPLKIHEDGTVQLQGKKQNAKWCIAKTFKIDNYQKLEEIESEKMIVYQVDPSNGFHFENLRVVSKEFYEKTVVKDNSREHIMAYDDVKNIDSKCLEEFPNFLFYKNGILYNKKSRVYSKGKLTKKRLQTSSNWT